MIFMIKLPTDLWRECTICAVFFSISLLSRWCIFSQHHSIIEWHKLILHVDSQSRHQLYSILKRISKSLCEIYPLSANSLPYRRLARTLNTSGSLSLTLAPVSTNAMISPRSLQAKCSLNPWHHPMVPFPSVAIPLNTLFAYLLRLWQMGIMVESTKVIPVHLPKPASSGRTSSGRRLFLPTPQSDYRILL